MASPNKKAVMKAKEDREKAFALSDLDPTEPIICRGKKKFTGVLWEFLSTHCFACPKSFDTSNALDVHNKTRHNKITDTVCSKCMQLVALEDYHELQIPKEFHSSFGAAKDNAENGSAGKDESDAASSSKGN